MAQQRYDEAHITSDELQTLFGWRDNNKELVRDFKPVVLPLIIRLGNGMVLTFTNNERTEELAHYPYTVEMYDRGDFIIQFLWNKDNASIFKLQESEISLSHKEADPLDYTDTLQSVVSAYASLMAYMEHNEGKVVPSKVRVKKTPSNKKKKKSNAKRVNYITKNVYTIKEEIDKATQERRTYTPPTHSYEVRGHWRTTKLGKRVWVRGYDKNKGKPKEPRTYKF